MKNLLKWIVASLALTVVFHFLTVVSIPYVIMNDLGLKYKMVYAKPVTAASRAVVKPSPDLIYSTCAFDVSRTPIRITTPVPNTYYSISAFDINTDNFFAINDKQIKSDMIEIVITGPDTSYRGNGKEIVITAPSAKGVVLFRMLIKDHDALDELIAIQKQATCSSIE